MQNEEKKRIEEELRLKDEEEKRIQDDLRLREKERIQEELRLKEEKRVQEEERIQEEIRLQDEEKIHEELRLQDEKRIQEELRLQEQERIQEEFRLQEAERIQEELRLKEDKRIQEELRLKDEKRIQEEFRLKEEKRIEEVRVSMSASIEAPNNSATTYVALYDFPGEQEEDLSFEAGDSILFEEAIDDNWWSGTCVKSGLVGIFPSAYVEKFTPSNESQSSLASIEMQSELERQAQLKTQAELERKEIEKQELERQMELTRQEAQAAKLEQQNQEAPISQLSNSSCQYRVIYEFSKEQDDELGVMEGDLLEMVEGIDEEWAQMRSLSGEEGLVPRNYFEAVGELVTAMYPFVGEADDELCFSAGDTIEIIERVEERWWRGRNLANSDEGVFPSNYVE